MQVKPKFRKSFGSSFAFVGDAKIVVTASNLVLVFQCVDKMPVGEAVAFGSVAEALASL